MAKRTVGDENHIRLVWEVATQPGLSLQGTESTLQRWGLFLGIAQQKETTVTASRETWFVLDKPYFQNTPSSLSLPQISYLDFIK